MNGFNLSQVSKVFRKLVDEEEEENLWNSPALSVDEVLRSSSSSSSTFSLWSKWNKNQESWLKKKKKQKTYETHLLCQQMKYLDHHLLHQQPLQSYLNENEMKIIRLWSWSWFTYNMNQLKIPSQIVENSLPFEPPPLSMSSSSSSFFSFSCSFPPFIILIQGWNWKIFLRQN